MSSDVVGYQLSSSVLAGARYSTARAPKPKASPIAGGVYWHSTIIGAVDEETDVEVGGSGLS